MIFAVVPAKNEAGRAAAVLRKLAALPIARIIFIANGCRDTTVCEVLRLQIPNLQFVYFREALGIDVPRAVGAKLALNGGCDIALFVDGDMTGAFDNELETLLRTMLKNKLDLGLTDCYPLPPRHIERCNPVFHWRLELNRALHLEKEIHLATPSHGPHAVSRRLLETVPLHELAIPPVALALARKHALKIGIATVIAHHRLGSAVKGPLHSEKIIDTIVGDCIEALAVSQGNPRSRVWQDRQYVGYHAARRFDILDELFTEL